MLDRLLNNPVLFTVIMVAIVVIAVGLILYFLVFKDKIKQYFENQKIEKEKRLARRESDKALASEVFANKGSKKKEIVPLTRKEQEDINKVILAAGNKSSSLASKPAKEQKPTKKLTAEEQAEIDKKLSSMHGGVSGVGKSQPKVEGKESSATTAEEQAEIDKKLSSMHGGVSGLGKSQPKKSKAKKTKTDKTDEEDQVTSGGLGFMDQFNKKDKE